MNATGLLDRDGIEAALRLLGERLARRGVTADLYVFGGAAMALAYDTRRTTRDVDAVFRPHGVVIAEANAVARELGLPQWWLNEQASAYVSETSDDGATSVFDHPGLRVQVASAEHLLAMKVLASRRSDISDITTLSTELGLRTSEEVRALVATVFPEETLPARADGVLDEALRSS